MRKDKMLMILGSLLILGLFIFPLWNISLEAPQYPTPLGMDIHITKFTGTHENDIKNINIMNHYVGMKPIPKTIPEFTIFPIVVIFMALFGVVLGFVGNYKWFLFWAIVMVLLGIVGIYDFYLWEYDYGHDLDPKAIMSFKNPDGTVMGFQPPLLGSKDILNFTAHSYPRTGAYFLVAGIILSFLAFFGRKKVKKKG